MMENKAWLRLMALTLVLPLAVACSQEEETEADIEIEAEPAPAAPVTVQITPQGGGMVAGEITATHQAEDTNLRISLTGLTEGKDYEARIRYGDCTIAMNYLDDEPLANDNEAATPATGTPETPGTMDDHETGEVVAMINLDRTGATASGSADIENDELRAGEAAYLVITEDSDEDVLVGCADLSGHGGMGTTPDAGAAPGAAMPADSAQR